MLKDGSRVPWLTLCVCTAAAAAHLLHGPCRDLLLLDRHSTGGLFLARLWTTHLLHVSGTHLMFNLLAGLVAMGWLELCSRRALAVSLLVSAPVSAMCTLAAMPMLANYQGLSGVLHGTVGGLLAVGFVSGRIRASVAGLLLVSLKLILENLGGGSLFIADPQSGEAIVAPLAHSTGFVAGFLACLLLLITGHRPLSRHKK